MLHHGGEKKICTYRDEKSEERQAQEEVNKMDFFIGMFFGGLAMAAAVAVSITFEPYGKITEYRMELGLEDIEEDEELSEAEK